jgi:glycosyltransferase involved in cell wall biosynthesis
MRKRWGGSTLPPAIAHDLRQRAAYAGSAAAFLSCIAGDPPFAPMRVAYLMTEMGCGGAEMQVLALAREMRHRGHEVVVLALRDEPTALAPKFAQAGIPCHSFGLNSPLNLVSALVRARRWAGDWRPDILHSHMVHANIFARLLRLLAARVPVVVGTAHSINEGGFVRTLAYRLTDPLTDITTNVSPDAVAAFIRKGACPASRIIYVANGLDLQHFRPDPQARARLRSELDLNGSYVFLAVGRLSPVKDYPTLIEGFCELRKTRQNACLLIAGDGPCRANIETLTVARSLEASVRLLGFRSDIPDLMNAADCFVMSSIFEGAPMALIEAMSCGKEIVTTEFGSASSLLGNAGLVVPIGKPDRLAAAMLKVANCRRDVNVEARDRAQALFSISTIVSKWESIYVAFLRRHNHAST